MCLLNRLTGKFNCRAGITIGLTCVVDEFLLLFVVVVTVLCVAVGITIGLALVLGELLLLFVVVAVLCFVVGTL